MLYFAAIGLSTNFRELVQYFKGGKPLILYVFGQSFNLTLTLIYGLLPWMTGSFDMLNRMALSLEESGIDPTRYYYTDVPQVRESEQYLRTVLE